MRKMDFGVATDMNGVTIRKGDKVIWHDAETDTHEEYEVYDEPTEEMVKLSNEFSECEAFPNECEVIQ